MVAMETNDAEETAAAEQATGDSHSTARKNTLISPSQKSIRMT